MIVCAIGYGYLSRFIFQRLCRLGITGLGITSKEDYINDLDNVRIFKRDKIKNALSFSSHLLITAPPQEHGCEILDNYSKNILHSNIRSILYISTTGVYGNHKGAWVNENSQLNATFDKDKKRLKAENRWKYFCNKNKINLNIIRISGFYGPLRIKNFEDGKVKIIEKEGHFFSRVHILDAARIISKIILQSRNNEIWNISDDKPTSRAEFLLEIIKIKSIKKYEVISYKNYLKTKPESMKKYWLNNKRISNQKVKKFFKYQFIFPTYKNGLKNLKEYL